MAILSLKHGKYTVIKPLGKGGMGALYLASETIANQKRLVVVKEMLDYYDPKDPKGEAKAHKRFETEAATLASLSIAGVPQIFDYFSDGGRNYIVMQFIEGQNLETGLTHLDEQDNLVRGKSYPPDQVRRWGIRISKILEALAAQSIIHMDIKPANLIVDKSGEVWLVDFGTAKAQGAVQPGVLPGTHKPSVYGTPGYAPPEQSKGQAEARSDVYALAATLYHLLTDEDPGKQPYSFPLIDRFPKDISRALKLALVKDVKQRLTASEFGLLLGIHTGGSPPFRWQDGTVSYEPKDLVMTANRKWDEARVYFQGDEWNKWLKDLHRHDLAAQMHKAKTAQADIDLALDAFLRILDPAFPLPKLQLPISSLNAGVIPWQAQRELTLKVANQGCGCLQGRCANVPPGLQVEPVEFVTHQERLIKVKVDARLLSPANKPQKLYITLEAGSGGRQQVPVLVNIPEPDLRIDATSIEMGALYRGQDAAYTFYVSNTGGSAFLGEVKADAAWVKVAPTRFHCPPGKNSQLNLKVDTREMALGDHDTRLNVWARAGKWERAGTVQLNLQVSAFKTFLKYWAPPLAWVSAWSVYGWMVGALLGMLVGKILDQMATLSTVLLVGALFGALLYVFPMSVIGWLGGLGDTGGLKGAKKGATAGIVPGVIVGILGGALSFQFLIWLGFGFSGGLGFDIFGMLVGFIVGALLGIMLWLTPRG